MTANERVVSEGDKSGSDVAVTQTRLLTQPSKRRKGQAATGKAMERLVMTSITPGPVYRATR